ncbi:hypothetical protein BCV72DRAFT_230897 [Rhizopus microsporus var. microsporus]|uniref:Uncharacterized protein n=2 Tax=Rhizopus microsporus TaxID=58291 RepID=A0A2G4T668_RHIZD|nr:uncharacterized protein RHIMIDRAFT_266233 [Rhizopus microsporus ATCC 52813]ORE04843.1 hypothetical protein BCV72DRAFT_230897 [Rhizopus microsporus var. microsporus]PHZ16510.1 hypothetical protein RHIMIDRAFT_266233 [Rhizopus microsporus ATCC 52813]
MNTLVTHTFALTKFIFINELEKSESFDLQKYAQKEFYMQIYMALVQKKVPAKTSKSIKFRGLIESYMEEYCQLSGYVPVELKCSH